MQLQTYTCYPPKQLLPEGKPVQHLWESELVLSSGAALERERGCSGEPSGGVTIALSHDWSCSHLLSPAKQTIPKPERTDQWQMFSKKPLLKRCKILPSKTSPPLSLPCHSSNTEEFKTTYCATETLWKDFFRKIKEQLNLSLSDLGCYPCSQLWKTFK